MLDLLELLPSNERVGVSFSGGVDSTVLVAALLENNNKVFTFSFDDGNYFYKTKELISINELIVHYNLQETHREIRFMDTDFVRCNDSLGFMPGYKMGMQIAAMSYCVKMNIPTLMFGYNTSNDSYLDESEDSIRKVQDLFNSIYGTEYQSRNVKCLSPWRYFNKSDVVGLGAKLGVPFNYTHTCSDFSLPTIYHCGRCKLCKVRSQAFADAGVIDTGLYI